MTFDYPFTEEESKQAFEEWGANCGPNALAFVLRVPLAKVRGLIPGFEEKRYTSPTMMKTALSAFGTEFSIQNPDVREMFRLSIASAIQLVRVQWCGPWTDPGANPKWAYRATHWIAAWGSRDNPRESVFDVNGGIMPFESWKKEIVPAITGSIPRADGDWFPTHVWRLRVR